MPTLPSLQRQIWSGSLPLEIRLAPQDCRTYNDSFPYLIQVFRLSYLPFLILPLHAFFLPSLIDPTVNATEGWLEFEGVPLKWHYPVGLLCDLYAGADQGGEEEKKEGRLPWRVTVHYSDFPDSQLWRQDLEANIAKDGFNNAVKEADSLRNGSARTMMGMSKADQEDLWRSVTGHDLDLFNKINNKLLYPPGVTLRHIPTRIYLPAMADEATTHPIPEATADEEAAPAATAKAGHVRVVQSLIPLLGPQRKPQTLGSALKTMLPTIFPSSRNPILAQPMLHGAVVPLLADLLDLSRVASYADGFLHITVIMMG
nr:hypothetical protein B0A51_05209 [Rachicladosporium sp. CCFEE 5018]